MRTLVISDLHLGTRTRRSVLEAPAPVEALLAALEDVDRLVLLGDVVELLEGRDDQALGVAEPVLRAIGARMAGGEIVMVPGNHDYALVQAGLNGTAAIDERFATGATPLLARVTSWLAPARVTVHYPGVWLADGVFAMHGHYVNRHLAPHEPWGMLRRGESDHVAPAFYDERPEVWLKRDVRRFVGGSASPAPILPPWQRPLVPLAHRVLRAQVRRAVLPGAARVVQRLGVEADVVLFGHFHRRGPLDGDDRGEWLGGGRVRLVNTGSWLWERMLLHGAGAPHPYWPGGAVVIEDGEEPRSVGLLDELDSAALF